MKKRFNGITIGGTSILTVLVVLCLTVFSVLTLVSARADRNLAQNLSANIIAFYDSEKKAAVLYGDLYELYKTNSDVAAFSSAVGEKYPDSGIIISADGDALTAEYSIEISNGRFFAAKAAFSDGKAVPLVWEVQTDESGTTIDDDIHLWDGETLE